MECVHCGCELPLEIHDTTYCTYNSPRYREGTHTGNIYRCEECEGYTLELVQEKSKLIPWGY